jgi:integrase
MRPAKTVPGLGRVQLAKLAPAHGVEHRGIHHLRHAFVTLLAEQGVHERVAQHLAGHADGRMTREVYTHVTRTMLDGGTAVVERAALDLHERSREQVGPQLGPGLPGGTSDGPPAADGTAP